MEKKIGLVGLDTSHVEIFTRMLNDPTRSDHIPGAKVVVAFPGGSPDIPLSHDRVPGFTQKLRDELGVRIVDSPEAVAEACDILCIESIDGRVHIDHLRQTIRYRRPTFIDKPLSHCSAEAVEMFRMARDAGIPLMSCSSLRYAEPLMQALSDEQLGAIVGCDVFGPANELPMPPGLFWYGIHSADPMFRVMGPGCIEVRAVPNADGDVVTGVWADGRTACLRGLRKGHNRFGITIHREKGFQHADLGAGKRQFYELLLEAIMRSLPAGVSDVPEQETLEVIRFLEAANESRIDGKPVRI